MTPALFMRSQQRRPERNLGLQKKWVPLQCRGVTPPLPLLNAISNPAPPLSSPGHDRVHLNCQRKQPHNDLTAVADGTWYLVIVLSNTTAAPPNMFAGWG